MTVHCRLEALLKERGVGMSQMAKDLKVGRGTLWKLANDPQYNPSRKFLEMVCRYLEIDVGDLLSLKKEKK